MTAFSIKRNFDEIFIVTSNSNEISSLHAIRFINVVCVFLCHKSLVIYFDPYTNKNFFFNLGDTPLSYPFRAAYIYTDVFLMLSGLLMSHSIIGKLQKGQKISFVKEIIGRYLRMMPSLAAIVILSTFVLPIVGSGPKWNLITAEADLCRQFGWRNFLMIHNWFGIEKICIPQTHQIATDFTLFAFSLLLVVFLHRQPKLGAALIGALGFASMIARFYVTFREELVVFVTFGVK